jgi:two-component system chemotaxis sensor kinase CheA
VDLEAVARSAAARQAVALSDADLLEVLCAPGLSTRAQATTTSGRGIGLHVVKRVVVAELGGELGLHTAPGAGTTFTLRVPLTVAILDALAFQCADQRFVAPVTAIDEIVELDAVALRIGPARACFFERRGAAVPVVPLALALWGAGEPGRAGKALIVRRAGEATAFVVDRLLGRREAVVRPLADPLVRVRGVSGATDLGDGRPTLVLDLIALAAAVTGERAAALAEVS